MKMRSLVTSTILAVTVLSSLTAHSNPVGARSTRTQEVVRERAAGAGAGNAAGVGGARTAAQGLQAAQQAARAARQAQVAGRPAAELTQQQRQQLPQANAGGASEDIRTIHARVISDLTDPVSIATANKLLEIITKNLSGADKATAKLKAGESCAAVCAFGFSDTTTQVNFNNTACE